MEKKTERMPVIGILPLVDIERESLWMLPGYMEGIREEGGYPIMLPLMGDKDEADMATSLCDGLLFTGGHDVEPSLYGEDPMMESVIPCPERDRTESLLLSSALEKDIPVLGICRGIQFLNVFLGGTLFQDLPTQRPDGLPHDQKPPYDLPSHRVDLKEGSGLRELLGKESIMVNTLHHQAVKELGKGLIPMAESPDGVVEAVMMEGKKFVWAVQWHPEFMIPGDEDSRAIFRRFVSACR